MKKTKILFYSSPNYAGSARALYEYMSNNCSDRFDMYWAIDRKEEYLKLKDSIKCVLYPSREFNTLFKDINVIFTTHGQLMDEKTDDQIYVNLWHGIGPKKAGYLLDDSNFAPQDRNYLFNLKVCTDYIIVPSPFWQLIFSCLFQTNYARVLPIGYPKFDAIVYADGKSNLERIFNISLSKYNKVVLYTPTFKKGLGREDEKANTNNLFDLDLYDEQLVLDYLKKEKVLLFIKYHPSEELKYDRVESDNVKYITEDLLKTNNLTVNDILNGCDILITDYSSLGVEFAFLDKPVIYLDNCVEEYMSNRGIIFDDNSFWAEISASNINELLDTISNCKKKYINKHRELFFGNLKDGGCDRIVDYFFDAKGKLRDNITVNQDKNKDLLKQLDDKDKEIKKVTKKLADSDARIINLENELSIIKNSKSYKIVNGLRNKIKR